MALVCHCYGVRDHGIRTAALAAGGDLATVQDACLAGTACGGCLPEVEAVCMAATDGMGASAATAA